MQDKTIKEHILSVAQTFEWGRGARLSEDGSRIVGLQHSFKSAKEAYTVAFSLPVSIEAVMDYRDTVRGMR